MRGIQVVLVLVAFAQRGEADNDASSSTSPYFSTDGSLGVPVFGSFVSLDDRLRPVIGLSIPIGPLSVQAIVDDAHKPELTDATTFRRVGSTDVGARVSIGGITRPGAAKEHYLVITCDAHPDRPDCLARDPRLSLGDGGSFSFGYRMTLPSSDQMREWDRLRRGWATEAIATLARTPFVAYVSAAARREEADATYTKLYERSASAGASVRAFASPFAGGTYVDIGMIGRAAWFHRDQSAVEHTLVETGLAIQLRVSSLDLALRFMWERHDVVRSGTALEIRVDWTLGIQPTIFF